MSLRGWWERRSPWRRKQNPVAAAAIEPEATIWGTGETWTPPKYGEYYARSVFVYSAVKLRADTIVRPPLRLYQEAPDGSLELLTLDHPLAALLQRVNPHWTLGDLLRATSTYLDLWGSAYWGLTRRSPSQPPVEIWPLRPDRMRVVVDRASGNPSGYIYQHANRTVPLLAEDVVWFRQFNPLDEYAGLSPIAALRLSADMGIDALKSNRNLFKEGLLFSNVSIQVKQPLTDQDVDSIWRRFKKKFAGPENAYRPIILGDGAEAKNLGFAPKDMEHLATLRWALEDVCRVFGIPKPMLADLERATFANIDAAERIFWRNTIVPYLMFLQGEINEMLVPQFGPGLRVEFDLSDIEALQPNQTEVANRERADVQSGILTINEVRADRGLEAVPWGDAWWGSMTLLPITSGATPPEAELPPGTPTAAMLSPDGHRRYEPPALSDENLTRMGNLHVKRLAPQERGFKDAQARLFGRQRMEVIRRLRGQKAIMKQVPGEPLFTPEEWLEAFVRTGGPLFLRALVTEAQAQIAQYGLGISFDVNLSLVQSWLSDRAKWWAGRVNEETGRLLMAEINEASKLGEGIPAIQQRVEKVFHFSSEVRSERIARTEMQAATIQGSLESYRQSGIVESKMWLCVTGDTRVAGVGISHIARRWYTGQMVELRTAAGRVLTVTTDHPILTGRGWVAAKCLHEGDNIVSYQPGMETSGPSAGEMPDINDMPPTIQEVFDSVYNGAPAQGMVTTIMNLNGERGHSDIDVIAVNSGLLPNVKPSGTEGIRQLLLKLTDKDLALFFADGSVNSPLMGFALADKGGPCEGRAVGFDFSRFPAGPHMASFRFGAGGLTYQTQTFVDTGPRTFPASCQGQDGITLSVLFGYDRCLSVKVYSASCHVYDYSTQTGWMIANSLVVHNSTIDERTRETHLEAHRQVVPLDAQFMVGGELISGPGDGSPANAISCRCDVAPLIGPGVRAVLVPASPKPVLSEPVPPTARIKKIIYDNRGLPIEIREQ